jgi:hypothetical protein
VLDDFWPNGGAISHVSIWGRIGQQCAPGQCDPPVVPEPGTMVLFGAGLVGLAAAVRRRLSA